MKNYYENNGKLYHLTRDPKYRELILFLNQLYREGLLDKEWIVTQRTLFSKKLTEGRVFATACAYWDLDKDRNQVKEKWGENADYYPYKVLGKGISADETTYNGRSTLGWDAIAVTDHCKNMDAVLKVIDFLASEEGQYLMLWGLKEKTGIMWMANGHRMRQYWQRHSVISIRPKRTRVFGGGAGL